MEQQITYTEKPRGSVGGKVFLILEMIVMIFYKIIYFIATLIPDDAASSIPAVKVIGNNDDAAGNAYPDCSSEFNDSINRAIYLGSGGQLSVVAPFIGLNKAQVVAKGIALNVPYELTWSCYEGGERPCGMCGTCRDRAAAFAANGITDPAMKGDK